MGRKSLNYHFLKKSRTKWKRSPNRVKVFKKVMGPDGKLTTKIKGKDGQVHEYFSYKNRKPKKYKD